jgi:HAD superfamily hydrolase (TIGR01490 family)
VAAFDFDGTLTEGGSVFEFLCAVSGRRTVYAAAASLSARLAHAALAGGTVADVTKEELFERVLTGTPVARLEEVAAEFAPAHLARHGRPDVRARFDWHRQRGDRLVVVSASLDAYVRVAGEILGADDVVATRLAADQGVLTGRYEGANCRGEEKVRRLRQWIDRSGGSDGPLWAYGNSRGDLRMLRAADVGVNVGRLGRLGRLRDFPGLDGTRIDGAP